MSLPSHFAVATDPVASATAQVSAGSYRVTVLGDRLVRVEYDKRGRFEDRASQVVWFRRFEPPAFHVTRRGASLEVDTGEMVVAIDHVDVQPKSSGLRATIASTGATWRYGASPQSLRNLGGTQRTHDGAGGPLPLGNGLIARDGCAVLDDGASALLDAAGWLEPRRGRPLDLYVFGHGLDYPAALADFARIAGPTPLVPRWSLGNWWSRYWAYQSEDVLALADEFAAHEVPLSVMVLDMDWHVTETGIRGEAGWTGYTWNRDLIPDPPALLAELHRRGLRTSLNLHPAAGVAAHEDAYAAVARRVGIDPARRATVPFAIGDPAFAMAYFEELHHPLEADGVDCWWMDWQQGGLSNVEGLDPLWWLNHLHFRDSGRERSGDGPARRPMLLSRWGGMGNHRYPIGFSGDTFTTWSMLGALPRATAAAANVGFGWWSHDVGGHQGRDRDDELYARWVQHAVFSPIVRLHSTNKRSLDRRPWSRTSPAARRAAMDALRLRHRLVPYLYSMAWRNAMTAVPLVTPMYYSHPGHEEAYHVDDQYWFGSELMVAPFLRPAGRSGRSSRDVWLPDGDWFGLFDGTRRRGGSTVQVDGGLSDVPVFARAGAIVPLASSADSATTESLGGLGTTDLPDRVDLHVFPGTDGAFVLYEDDGWTRAHEHGASSATVIRSTWSEHVMTVAIDAPAGDAGIIPADRTYAVRLVGIVEPTAVRLLVDGVETAIGSVYDDSRSTLAIDAFRADCGAEVRVEAAARSLMADPIRSRPAATSTRPAAWEPVSVVTLLRTSPAWTAFEVLTRVHERVVANVRRVRRATVGRVTR